MKRANIIATACLTALVATVTLMTARAQDFIGLEKSKLTFSAPVELPGMTLPAGTYTFKRPDPNTARIIQVFTEDEKKILGTFLTVPTKRLEVTSDNVVTFKERDAKAEMAPAVHYWYYPGLETGHEFVYPKDQAMKIAARSGERVMSMEGDVSNDAKVTAIEPQSASASAADTSKSQADTSASASASATPAPAPAPETQVASNDDHKAAAPEVNINRQSSASTSTAAPEPPKAKMDRDRNSHEAIGTSGQADTNTRPTDTNRSTASANNAALPKTASPLPLSGLISLLSFGGAAALRRVRQVL